MTTSDAPISDILPIMIEVAIEAGALVMHGFGGNRGFEAKSDGSPVTECDRNAEELIAERLDKAFPGIPLVGEEGFSEGHVPTELGHRFFLVDPLDGTREFVAGLPDFTVNIALVENDAPVAGVVFAPAYGELFFGSGDGAGKARVDEDGAWHGSHPIEARVPPERLIAVVSRSHYDSDTDGFLSDHELEATVPVGSSLKFCRIAEGAADLYPKLGRTMEWDTAAGQAVLEAAGGSVRRLDGTRLSYGRNVAGGRADFANPPFAARGRDEPAGIPAPAVDDAAPASFA